jgi:hypothetical protein
VLDDIVAVAATDGALENVAISEDNDAADRFYASCGPSQCERQ